MNYQAFLDQKAQDDTYHGFDPIWMPSWLMDFQAHLVDWAVRKGKAAIFADCGLGKTPIQLVWAENVHRKTGKPVLILTPLAVSSQTIRESEKFGMSDAQISREGEIVSPIVVTNYERLHYFNPADFSGCVCDESSILKSYDGSTRLAITEFMKKLPYRLLCTATAAPNDYIELGTSSEALGELGYMDMLSRFFKNDQNTNNPNRIWAGDKWRFKGHAEIPFWRWVCSWARAIRRPSDLGFSDDKLILPPLRESEHVVKSKSKADGYLFSIPASGLWEERQERKRTIAERCEKVAELVGHGKPALVWCHLNVEGDLLEKIIPDAVQVSGDDSDDVKEGRFLDFISGKVRVLVTKPKIGAWGLNFQHCSHVTFFPSHSFEQYYQGVRRCWRFGQTNPVTVDLVTTEGERGVMGNLRRKAVAADKMFSRLVEHMGNAIKMERHEEFTKKEEVPAWQ